MLWLLASAIAIGGYMPIKDIVKESQMQQLRARLEEHAELTDDQRQQALDRQASQFDNPVYLVFVPAGQLVMLVVVSGVLLFIGNIVLGGNLSYLRTLNCYAWIGMIVIPATIVTLPLVLAKGSMDVSIGLGALTGSETGAFLKRFLTSFELFGLWQVWLSSVAVAVMAESETAKAFWAVFIAWMVWVLAQSGLATLGLQFGA